MKPIACDKPAISHATHRRDGTRRVCRGHTLFEVLVALGLTLMLLSAIYSALNIHLKYSTAGQEEMERLQLVRALFERMERDVRSVIYRNPTTSVPPQNNAAVSQSPEATVTKIEVVQPTNLYVRHSVGIMGDSHRLHLRGPRDDAREVVWLVADNKASATAIGGAAGLVRLATGQRTVDPQSGQASSTGSIAASDVLAEEVQAIRFRYFDGSQWLDQWDSVAMRRLPRAVEIVIGFTATDSALRDLDDQQQSGWYRLVVAVPAYET